MISSESPVLEISTPGLMSGDEETWLRLRLRHRHRAKAAGNSNSLEPTAGAPLFESTPNYPSLSANLNTPYCTANACTQIGNDTQLVAPNINS